MARCQQRLSQYVVSKFTRSVVRRRSQHTQLNDVRLHDEIVAFANYATPTRDEDAQRVELLQRIELCLRRVFAPFSWRAVLFGSHRAGIALPTSDLDVVVIGDIERASLIGNQNDHLYLLANELRAMNAEHPEVATRAALTVLAHTRVPLVKWRDAATGLQVDFSFNVTDGPRNTLWVRERLDAWPVMRPLMLVVKQLLVARNLNDAAFGGLGGYALAICIASFLRNVSVASLVSWLCRGVLCCLFVFFLLTFFVWLFEPMSRSESDITERSTTRRRRRLIQRRR
jgi:non-canonical poly(A) RNA polymerase PAPD5/7